MRRIKFENVTKTFEGEVIIDRLNLEIPSAQFFALLGPSGCGKTTLLRLIAGLETLDSGKIYLGDEDITHLPIYKRRINTIFQNYALFPHLTIFENVAYSLRLKSLKQEIIEEKVKEALKTVRLSGFEQKMPQTLSGGQKQRVAIARAIVNEPDVLLLDEPLAALDLKLREEMLIELINLQFKLKTTFVYVTHDQNEALTVSDQMTIMNKRGAIEQIGTPKQIYEFPVSSFVANFVGNTNIIEGILHMTDKGYDVEVEGLGSFGVYVATERFWMIPGCRLLMSIRPEKIEISRGEREGFSNHLTGTVVNTIYYGRTTEYRVRLQNGTILMVFEQNEEHFPQETIDDDDEVHLYFQNENVVLLEH